MTGPGRAGHLRLATVMRPDNADYQAALEQVVDTDRETMSTSGADAGSGQGTEREET